METCLTGLALTSACSHTSLLANRSHLTCDYLLQFFTCTHQDDSGEGLALKRCKRNAAHTKWHCSLQTHCHGYTHFAAGTLAPILYRTWEDPTGSGRAPQDIGGPHRTWQDPTGPGRAPQDMGGPHRTWEDLVHRIW